MPKIFRPNTLWFLLTIFKIYYFTLLSNYMNSVFLFLFFLTQFLYFANLANFSGKPHFTLKKKHIFPSSSPPKNHKTTKFTHNSTISTMANSHNTWGLVGFSVKEGLKPCFLWVYWWESRWEEPRRCFATDKEGEEEEEDDQEKPIIKPLFPIEGEVMVITRGKVVLKDHKGTMIIT